ncbi:hypothetical protein AB0B25_11755 [Nocardia sp. NPDC049190]|uniref:hypothetical protein n=1 Tax=Nocardia sp. NPDC049190 TaxID=3155650 RepID=UPI0033F16D1A
MREDEVQLIVVDAANVVGSRPDGWWRDRVGATRRLLEQLATSGAGLGRPVEVVVVLEGAAKAALTDETKPDFENLRVLLADGSGDDAVVGAVAAAAEQYGNRSITVVTADRELRARVEAIGADTAGPRWLLARIDS